MTIEQAQRILRPLELTIAHEPNVEGFVVRNDQGLVVTQKPTARAAAEVAVIDAYNNLPFNSRRWRAAANACNAFGFTMNLLSRNSRRRRRPR